MTSIADYFSFHLAQAIDLDLRSSHPLKRERPGCTIAEITGTTYADPPVTVVVLYKTSLQHAAALVKCSPKESNLASARQVGYSHPGTPVPHRERVCVGIAVASPLQGHLLRAYP